jgi:hypothetical protein
MPQDANSPHRIRILYSGPKYYHLIPMFSPYEEIGQKWGTEKHFAVQINSSFVIKIGQKTGLHVHEKSSKIHFVKI